MSEREPLIVIHQPDFLPYLGFFHRLLKADIYVVLEHVQFVRGSNAWTSRDKIKTPQGARWVSLPVEKAPQNTPISEIRLKRDADWVSQHMALYRENYRNAPFYEEIMPHLEALYQNQPELLWEFTLRSIEMLAALLDVERPMLFSGEMQPEGKSNHLMCDLVKKAGSHRYLSGVGARDYYDPAVFLEAGVTVTWQQFSHPTYPQQFGEFVPYLSSIDALFNCGIAGTRRLLREECQ